MKKNLSNDEEKSKVWFQLVDSVTGEAYKGVMAEKVPLASGADVDDFRDAVKAKYKDQESAILTGIASSQLVVYETRAAFDKRNAVDGKVFHLNLMTGSAVEIISLFKRSWSNGRRSADGRRSFIS